MVAFYTFYYDSKNKINITCKVWKIHPSKQQKTFET